MRILIVDDNPAMRALSRRFLEQAGIPSESIEEARDGREALLRIESLPPDLILSDWNMPGLTGIDLLETLARRGSSIPLVLVSTEATPEMRDRASAAGARGFVTKPFTRESLISALTGLLR